MSYTECPKCGNKRIKEVGDMSIIYVRSVATGKMLQKAKEGYPTYWEFHCKCGWKSEEFTE
ncbi:hypothetical protein MOC08_13360 [Bacillus haynesii]|uniref:hypothetical protein n=1 Tax=Bacillus haynesii TaxID=1925021 RepID=UPI00227FBCC4|nr:hypothetical protein [Bacillus haynesii]MCY8242166.1 hypothetical protein [Bacillus haynesii]